MQRGIASCHTALRALVLLALAILGSAAASSRPRWPLPDAALQVLALPPAQDGDVGIRRKPRIYIDPGHGAPRGNTGNTSCVCESEEVFNARTAEKLYRGLAATGRFELKLSRKQGQTRAYQARVREAEAWGADVLLGIHSDCRGELVYCAADGGQSCPCSGESHDAAGFSLLYSDEDPELTGRRLGLAQALARRMKEAGFLPYDGAEYVPYLYESDDVEGSFVDRHSPGRRIYMLRKPRLASVIVETHHASDPEERQRWEEPRTHEAFAAAVAAAVLDLQAHQGSAQEPGQLPSARAP
ncbi:MAG: N-acetylmuramoyl-L-alanine amidase [Deltaproteobacteria bacterium]|nr:N-acetylmuramoyl-L-alanine amidase [Deltaproteobacteria bacterium]